MKKSKHLKLRMKINSANQLVKPINNFFFTTIGPDLAREISKTNFEAESYLPLVSLAPNAKTI